MDTPDWVARAEPIGAATFEVGFVLDDSFYYGPDDGMTAEQWHALREPLYRPAAARHGRYLLSAAAAEATGELVRHYADVLRLYDKYRRPVPRQPHYFWLQPLVFAPGRFEVDFPWHDTWAEAAPVLDALEAAGDGVTFEGLEQGWEVEFFAAGGKLFLRQGDFDTKAEDVCVSCDRAGLARQVPPLRARCERLLEDLRAALGRDYWSGR